jgi:hypothetical protein
MKLFQIVFSFTQKTEALYQVAANTEEEARKAVLNHPEIKHLPDLEISHVECLHEDDTDAQDLSKDRTIN